MIPDRRHPTRAMHIRFRLASGLEAETLAALSAVSGAVAISLQVGPSSDVEDDNLLVVAEEAITALVASGAIQGRQHVTTYQIGWDRVVAPGMAELRVWASKPPHKRMSAEARAKIAALNSARLRSTASSAAKSVNAVSAKA